MKKGVLSLLFTTTILSLLFISCKKDKDEDPFKDLYGKWEYTHTGIYNYETGATYEENSVSNWEDISFNNDGTGIEHYSDYTYEFVWKYELAPKDITLWGDQYTLKKVSNNEFLLLATPTTVDNYFGEPNKVWGYRIKKMAEND